MRVGKLDIEVRKIVKVRQKIYEGTCGILSLKLFHCLHVHMARTYLCFPFFTRYLMSSKGLLTFDI